MQISRHWRLNAKRYRLEGVRYETGEVSLQERPVAEQSMGKKTEHQTMESVSHPDTVRAVVAA